MQSACKGMLRLLLPLSKSKEETCISVHTSSQIAFIGKTRCGRALEHGDRVIFYVNDDTLVQNALLLLWDEQTFLAQTLMEVLVRAIP